MLSSATPSRTGHCCVQPARGPSLRKFGDAYAYVTVSPGRTAVTFVALVGSPAVEVGLSFDPNIAIDDDLHAPLHWACALGRVRIVKLLISAGADISTSSARQRSSAALCFANLYELLHLAMSKGKTHTSRYYLETMLGRLSEYPKELADVINWRDEDGETALTMAARCRSKRICKLLIDHGANPKVTNNDGKSAEMYIIEDEKFRASPILGPRSVSALSFR
ncbi:ankyrin, partial [Exidia glandulosa HHB12029]